MTLRTTINVFLLSKKPQAVKADRICAGFYKTLVRTGCDTDVFVFDECQQVEQVLIETLRQKVLHLGTKFAQHFKRLRNIQLHN